MKKILEHLLLFIMVCTIVLLFGYTYFRVHTEVLYWENTEDLKANFPKGTSNVSYFSEYGWRIYECKMSEEVFWQYAKSNEWKMTPIQRPIKIIRYKYYKTTKEEFKRQIENLTPETETKGSCFHFVKKGYYYIHEEKPAFYHVAYDSETNFLYVYMASTEGGQIFYMSTLDHSWSACYP
ncbi:MAG: hypothetical protein LBU65_11685 [Planctomycetaceae bacterium]|jgi:hypothetical protein|nr:hypothetical protein [Planctomycetaceae bacterium]